MQRRKAIGLNYSGKDIFACRVVCGDCGSVYGGKIWGSNTKYKRMVWRCNQKYAKGQKACSTPHVTEDEIKTAFVTVFNRLLANRDRLLSTCMEAMTTALDTTILRHDHGKRMIQLTELDTLLRALIRDNATAAKEKVEYAEKYNKLPQRFEATRVKVVTIEQQIRDNDARHGEIGLYLDAIQHSGDVLTEFDKRL